MESLYRTTDQTENHHLYQNACLVFPRVSRLEKLLGWAILTLLGWDARGEPPEVKKYVAVFAPHTMDQDGLMMFALTLSCGIRTRIFVKEEFFRKPFGWLIKRLGGVPIHRNSPLDQVSQAACFIRASEKAVIGLSPEGTRQRTDYWRSGFYYIAWEANVPLLLTALDYVNRVAIIGPIITPSGDIHRDMDIIRKFYETIPLIHPERFGEVRVRPDAHLRPYRTH